MNVKLYLSRLHDMDNEIESLQKNQTELISQTFRRADISDMKVQSSSVRDIWTEIGDYAVTIQKKIEVHLKTKLLISQQIDKDQDDKCRQVLRYRYPIGLSWEQIANIMHYDLRWVYRLHGKALIEFEKDCPNYLLEYEQAIKSHAT